MERMGVIGSTQPGLIGVVAHWPDIQALTAEQGIENMSNWRRMLDAGVPMAGSPFNPDGASDEYTTDSHMSPMGVMNRGAARPGGKPPRAVDGRSRADGRRGSAAAHDRLGLRRFPGGRARQPGPRQA